MRSAFDLGASREHQRLAQVIPQLPVELVVGDAQERSRFAARKLHAELEIFPATVHVRMQTVQCHGRSQLKFCIHPVVGITRGNLEFSVRCRERQDALCRRLLCKDQADAATVRAGFSVGGVMDLKNDVGTGLDQLGLSGLELLRRLARSVPYQKIARQFARVLVLVSLYFLGHERNSRSGLLQPSGSGLADERNNMVHVGAVSRPCFRELNPAIRLERRRDHDVLILDGPGCRDLVHGRQVNHGIGLRDRPAVRKISWRRHVFRISLRRAAIHPRCHRIDFTLRERGVV